MTKYILDTNIFMRDPEAVYAFHEHDVYVPLTVLVELDRHKKGTEEHNVNARAASRILDELVTSSYSSEGIPLNGAERTSSGKLYFIIPKPKYNDADEHILEHLNSESDLEGKGDPEDRWVLITNDVNLRVRAKALGFEAEGYRHDKNIKNLHELLNMPETVELPHHALEALRSKGFVVLQKKEFSPPQSFFNNQYLYVDKDTLLLRYKASELGHEFYRLNESISHNSYAIWPRNKEQKFLFDLCLNDEIEVGTVLGPAGTGKTLVALTCALESTLQNKKYDQILIIRPVAQVGEELGYLPGDLGEKIAPLMGAIEDAAKVIFRPKDFSRKNSYEENNLNYLINEGKIVLGVPNYMRGRNTPKTFIFVDEAQNLTPNQVKTLGTRTGEGSKIIFSGDPFQIDVTHLDETNNGLVSLTKSLLGESIFSTVILKKTERSRVAETIARLM